jgi:ABC-2 type transport system permease protein
MKPQIDLRRLLALLRKEFVQVVRDPSAVMIAFVMPVMLLLLNGYGLSLDARHVPFGVAVEMETPDTLGLYRAFVDTPYLDAHRYASATEAGLALARGEIRGFLVVRAETVRRLPGDREQPFLIVVDGVDANTARLVEGYASAILDSWYRRDIMPAVAAPRIGLEHRYWFNPELRSASFIVPGLVAVVMTLVGALLTALIVAREWERGTMESLLASPATAAEVMSAKLLSNFLLAMAAMVVSVLIAVLLFHVPLRGSIWVLTLISALFLASALSLGLLISTIARNQFVAAQLTFIVTYMPALMLSGLLFDISSMPLWVQDLTRLVPARYFVSSLQTIFLVGDVRSILLPDGAVLAGFGLGFFLLALRRMPRDLEA